MMEFNFGAFVSQDNQIKRIPIDKLVPYHNHKFSLYTGERLNDMVESIKTNGVITPIITRPIKGTDMFEILSGHNRWNAAKIAGLTDILGLVKENLTDEDAEMYVIETNLIQRGFDDLKITEQAAVVTARHNFMFDEDKRKAIERELALLNGEMVEEETTSEKKSKLAAVGENYGLKKDSIARLIRIDTLIEELKPFVDAELISKRAATTLSYLSPTEQQTVAQFASGGISLQKAKLLREVSEMNKLTSIAIKEILTTGKYGNDTEVKAKPKKVKIDASLYEKYFDTSWDDATIQKIVATALEEYFAKIKSENNK